MKVLLTGRDPSQLREYVEPLLDRDDAVVFAIADEEDAIERLDEGGLDCLVAAYDPSGGQGMQLLDHLREAGSDVPVILLPSTRTTVIDSRNFVVDVAAVVEPNEAPGPGGLAADVVDTVEHKRTSVAARRRSRLEGVIREVARDAARADAVEEVAEAVVDRLGRSPTIDAAWIAALENGDVTLQASAEGSTAAVPPPVREAVGEAVRTALDVDGPQATARGDYAVAAVPVDTPAGDRWAVAVAAESRYAFAREETQVLAELRATLDRSLAAVESGRTLSLGADSREAFVTLIEELEVPVVAYGEAGWVVAVSEGFAGVAERPPERLRGEPVWEVLPEPRLETFDDYWASFDRGDTRTRTVPVGGDPRQLITTRVEVDGAPYNVALAVAPDAGAGADAWLSEVLAYELRHWVGVAGEGDADEEALASVGARVQAALKSEVAAADADGPHVAPQPLGQVASDAWQHVLGAAGDSEIHGGRTVLADRTVLFRLFAHLFRTLLTYGEASAVEVGVIEGGFFVEDDGSGIDHADRAYAESATMTDAKSGASIRAARRLADRHGWELSVDANDAGGTRFEVAGVRRPSDA